MIYEAVVMLRPELAEDAQKEIKEMVQETISSFEGESLINDDWGVKSLAQATETGLSKGHFFYVMYRANANCNAELARKVKIDERIDRHLIVSLGEDRHQDKLTKVYKRPGASAEGDKGRFDLDKERKLHAKRRSCWFSANKTSPDWKDPSTYAWLVNEFGKISPARVTGLTPKFQRKATEAIKRGRCMGFISYLSNRIAR